MVKSYRLFALKRIHIPSRPASLPCKSQKAGETRARLSATKVEERGVKSLYQLLGELGTNAPDPQALGVAFEDRVHPSASRTQGPGLGVVLEARAAARDRSPFYLNADSGQTTSGLPGPSGTGIDGKQA